MKTTNLFDDFDPVSSNNGNKKSPLNLRDRLQTLIWIRQRNIGQTLLS
jgi:hypothetical protein